MYPPTWRATYESSCGTDPSSDACKKITGQIKGLMGGLNIYDLIGVCYNQTIGSYNYAKWMNLNSEQNDIPPCIDAIGAYKFFRNDTVRKALHISEDAPAWEMCSDEIEKDYKMLGGSYYLYPTLIKAGLRIWVYSGDTDGSVPITGTLYWLDKIRKELNLLDLVKWRLWSHEGANPDQRQNGGQFWSTDGFTFVAFRGVGHMVPQFNRQGSFDMINAFMTGGELPEH